MKRFVSSRLSHDIYLGCGVAAAISAGFGAPIAGIVFAHEAVLRHFSVRAIAPISIASVTASAVSQSFFNTSATFNISTSAPDLVSVIPVLIIASPIIAIAAIVYGGARRSVAIAKGTGWSAERLVITAATICGLVGIWIPEILGLGIGTINAMLDGSVPTTCTDSAFDRQDRDDCAMYWIRVIWRRLFSLLYLSASLSVGSSAR